MVHEELKNYFSSKGIKQTDIAEKTGLKKSFVSELLAGKRTLGGETAVKLKEAYGFDIDWLLTGEGAMFKADATAQQFPEAVGSDRLEELKRQVDDLSKQVEELKADKHSMSDTIKALRLALELAAKAGQNLNDIDEADDADK